MSGKQWNASEAFRQVAEWNEQLNKLFLIDKRYVRTDVWDTFARLAYRLSSEQFSVLFNILVATLNEGGYQKFCTQIAENGLLSGIEATGLKEWIMEDVFQRLFMARVRVK